MDSYSIYLTSQGKTNQVVEGGYTRSIPALLFALAIIYGAFVEGQFLAYAIIAYGVWNLGFGIYRFVTSYNTKYNPVAVVFNSIISILFIYWGWQRYSAIGQVMVGGRRKRL